MKNTLENKAKFFAQYWGQDALCFQENKYCRVGNPDNWLSPCYLELKPLLQINDEDAIKVCNLFHGGQVHHNKPMLDYVYEHIERVVQDTTVADYLRSKGYALDWNGITVEEQIEFGWVKLKTN